MTPHPHSPLVSVILTTRDRPRLLSLALDCYRHQTYARRELIVVDDGTAFPADPGAVSAVGGRLIRVPEGTPLGFKLNRGASEARGILCQKMDDDDWYASRFLETMVTTYQLSRTESCSPTMAFISHFLFFDVIRWEMRQSVEENIPGATLLFERDSWEERPFRALFNHEDIWFLMDHVRLGATTVFAKDLEAFIAIRHGAGSRDRGHTWTHQSTGQRLEEYLQARPLHHTKPETLFPPWALSIYRELHNENR